MTSTRRGQEMWSTLDATILQWLYATISHDLLHIIPEPDTTAMEVWNHLRDIFQDNKHSRVVTLEYEFIHVDIVDFSNVSAYCVATLIRQCDPLPQFYQARSMLTLEEDGRDKKAAQSSSAALVALSSKGSPNVPDNSSSNRNSNGGKKNHN
ncbi:uncharacterized protein LOC129883486 [Solanum dulcamara]|uniref:uncharacterized protein LOC129883486 n=1 Tax=Solanum dulcamara TaxID=45834 RepID=UPI0024867FF4|nr:uncharacterized protein LOC129883486 [Solanum dulcamara]